MEKIIKNKTKELLEFIKENVEKGYNIYSDIRDINKLIDIIVKWYEFKYPLEKIKMIEEYYKYFSYEANDIKNIENLSSNMGYTELMFRIPENMHAIIECWYKGEEDKKNSDNIKTHIDEKNTLIDSHFSFDINKYDGSIDVIRRVMFDGYLGINCTTIEEFVDINNYSKKIDYSEIDFEDPKKIVLIHELDLKLRDKIFEIVALKLLFSNEDMKVGYIRTKKFIEEFEKYIYNLNLFWERYSILIYDYINIKVLGDVVDYILDVLKEEDTENKKIDEYGLTFKTIKTLKSLDIHRISDLPVKNIPSDITFPKRDKDILSRMHKNAEKIMHESSEKIMYESIMNMVESQTKKSLPKKKLFSQFKK